MNEKRSIFQQARVPSQCTDDPQKCLPKLLVLIVCKYQSFWGWGCSGPVRFFWVTQKRRLEDAGAIPEGFAGGYGLFCSAL